MRTGDSDRMETIGRFLDSITPLDKDAPNCPSEARLVVAAQGRDAEARKHAENCSHCGTVLRILEVSAEGKHAHLREFLAKARAAGQEASHETPASFWRFIFEDFSWPARAAVGAVACLIAIAALRGIPVRSPSEMPLEAKQNTINYDRAVRLLQKGAVELKVNHSIDADTAKEVMTVFSEIKKDQLTPEQRADLISVAADYNSAGHIPLGQMVDTEDTQRLKDVYQNASSAGLSPQRCVKLEHVTPEGGFVFVVDDKVCRTEPQFRTQPPQTMALAIQKFDDFANGIKDVSVVHQTSSAGVPPPDPEKN
jgi:hypothetical protein